MDEKSFDKKYYLTGGRNLLIQDYVYEVILSKARTRILPIGEKTIARKMNIVSFLTWNLALLQHRKSILSLWQNYD